MRRGEESVPPTYGPPVPDPWVLAYDEFDPEQEGLREALCALGNGRFVTRGAAEECGAGDVHYPGTYVAGGYNRLTSEVAGHTVVNEDLVNFPNWLPLTFRPGPGEWLDLDRVEILAYRQELELAAGLLRRRFRVRDGAGRETTVEARRLVSMCHPHLAMIDYRITPENWDGELRIRSELDATVTNAGVARYRQLAGRHLELLEAGPVAPQGVCVVVQTSQSRIQVAEAARTRVFSGRRRMEPERRIVGGESGRIGEELVLTARRGETLRVEKAVALFSSRDRGISEPGVQARLAIGSAPGFEEALADHRLAWQALWRRYDVDLGAVPGGERSREQLILRLHVFHLLQTVSAHTVGLDVGAPARGLHGEAYRGHVFWDELFILPFYNLRRPSITRSLLLYRYYRLDAARDLAREAGFRGAMYPWQSSSDGREATQQLHLNPLSGRWDPDWSRLQRHVNAAIVYNVWRYWEATADRMFLVEHGAEMVLEIARFWSSAATWSEERGRFEIHGVMGPDEYHEKYPGAETGGLRNNAYTNVMAVWCLARALDVLDVVGASRRSELLALLAIREDELERWRDITRRMFVPFHGEGIVSQFEGYEELEEFDWEGYRKRYGDIERLDRILKAEGDTPDRYQVSKQADMNMLFYLFETDELCRIFCDLGYTFDEEMARRNIRYYMPRTSHGSTLSKMVFASIVHRFDPEAGRTLFFEALRSDIDDIQRGTTAEGIHLGAMAGTVAIVLTHFAGIELRPDEVFLDPDLPHGIPGIDVRLHWQGRWLDLRIAAGTLRLTADADVPAPVPVRLREARHEVPPGETLELEW